MTPNPTVTTSSPEIQRLIAACHLAPRQAHKSLTIWPLVRSGARPAARYRSLADALGRGSFTVHETDERGIVSRIAIHNHGAEAVLVLFGEELVGAKQNRIANASFLVPAGDAREIDVSCVEAGRWHAHRGLRFDTSERVVSSRMRRSMSRGVAMSRAAGQGFRSDQQAVWEEVQARLTGSGTPSASSAYSDHAVSRATDLAEIRRAFQPVDGQVGFVAAIGDEIEGAEVVGDPRVFAASFARLLDAYAIDAVDAAVARAPGRGEPAAPLFEAPEDFLSALASAPVSRGPSLGAGEDLRIEGEGLGGCVLVDGEVVHLMAFPEGSTPPRRSRIA